MKFVKAIIIDLDDTIYSYTKCHEKSLELLESLNLSFDKDDYKKSRKYIHSLLENTASMHNKLLHFINMNNNITINYNYYIKY